MEKNENCRCPQKSFPQSFKFSGFTPSHTVRPPRAQEQPQGTLPDPPWHPRWAMCVQSASSPQWYASRPQRNAFTTKTQPDTGKANCFPRSSQQKGCPARHSRRDVPLVTGDVPARHRTACRWMKDSAYLSSPPSNPVETLPLVLRTGELPPTNVSLQTDEGNSLTQVKQIVLP